MATYSVYYMKSEFFRDGLMGYDRLKNNNLLPDPDDLAKTHVFLKLIEARNLEQVYLRCRARIGARPARRVSSSPAKVCGIPRCP